LVTLGTHGSSAYLAQLTGPLPTGAAWLTVEGALGVAGPVAMAVRLLIVSAALIAAWRLRGSPGLVIVAGLLGSVLAPPFFAASAIAAPRERARNPGIASGHTISPRIRSQPAGRRCVDRVGGVPLLGMAGAAGRGLAGGGAPWGGGRTRRRPRARR